MICVIDYINFKIYYSVSIQIKGVKNMRVFKRSTSFNNEIIIINLEPDEFLLESIIKYLKDNNIKNACILSGIGTLKKLSYHRVLSTSMNPENEYLSLEGPFELSSLQGLIINFEPHLHFVASDLNNTYSGHIEFNSQVLYLAEIVLLTLKDFSIKRNPNEKNIYFIEED
jgi:predicted DNA-binding protein with PD1-like motif